MSDPTIWLVVVVVLLIAGAGVLIRLRRGRGTPRKAERVDAPATEVADLPSRGTPAADSRPATGVFLDASGPSGDQQASPVAIPSPSVPRAALQGPQLRREQLIDRDRVLDPTRWDNRPDGTEEHDGDASGGGAGVDAGFIQALRERGKAPVNP